MTNGSRQNYDIGYRITMKELQEMKKKNLAATAPFVNHPYAVKKEKTDA